MLKANPEPLKPKKLHNLDRLKDIVVKIVDFYEAGLHVPEEWFDEIYEIIRSN
jgi:hypothetical protein